MTRSIVGALLNRSPVNYAGKGQLFGRAVETASRSASERNLSAMEAQSTVFAIVDRLASSIAKVEWTLYRQGPDGKPDHERPVDTPHPAKVVWAKPNPHFTRSEFVETLQQHFELTGEMNGIVVRPERMPSGPPVELWPVRPDRLTPVPDPAKFIKGYEYVHGEQRVTLAADEVIRSRRPNPLSMYRGLGPIGSLIMDIDGDRAAAEWNAQFFRNGAEPGGIIKVPELLEDEEFEKLQEHWNSQHRGVRNAHRVAIIEYGEWVDRKMSMRDMQFEQLRRFSKESIRGAWGFPKPLLGDVEDVNRANADAGNVVFAQWLIVPRLDRWRSMLNDDLLPMFGSVADGVAWDYADPVPPNAQQEGQSERLRALSAASFVREGFAPDDVLRAFGFPPMKWTGPPEQRYQLEHADELETSDDQTGES